MGSRVFESTAVVASEVAMVFEVIDGAYKILEERLRAVRYSGNMKRMARFVFSFSLLT